MNGNNINTIGAMLVLGAFAFSGCCATGHNTTNPNKPDPAVLRDVTKDNTQENTAQKGTGNTSTAIQTIDMSKLPKTPYVTPRPSDTPTQNKETLPKKSEPYKNNDQNNDYDSLVKTYGDGFCNDLRQYYFFPSRIS